MGPVMARERVGDPDLCHPQALLHGQRGLLHFFLAARVVRRTVAVALGQSWVRIGPEARKISVPAHTATAARAAAYTAAARIRRRH